MSFRDFVTASRQRNVLPTRQQREQPPTPRIKAMPPASESSSSSSPQRRRKSKGRSVVLHGKVEHLGSFDSKDEVKVSPTSTMENLEDEIMFRRDMDRRDMDVINYSIRNSLQRRSTFALLTRETQQFQKLVTEIESLLEVSTESAESAWRARILISSAKEADKDLWDRLYQYERTLLVRAHEPPSELRAAQTACMKIHRDFKRAHKGLIMALSLYEKRQRADISQLGAVGWSDPVGRGEQEEDFYERAMRERDDELKRMNKSMHKVNEIYQELAALVEDQQGSIDFLEEDIEYSKKNVEAATDAFTCLRERDQWCGALEFSNPWDPLNLQGGRNLDMREEPVTGATLDSVPEAEKFAWYMPFQTFTEDMSSVRHDLFGLGEEIVNIKNDKISSTSAKSKAATASL